LLDPLSLDVLEGKFVEGVTIKADAQEDQITFTTLSVADQPAA